MKTMKQNYQAPTSCVILFEQAQMLCNSPVQNVNSNVGITGGNTGSTGNARVKEQGSYDVWNEDWNK